jgi:hypothetical protein
MSNNRAGMEGWGGMAKIYLKMNGIHRYDFLGHKIFPSVSKGYCANLAHMLYIKTVNPQFYEICAILGWSFLGY